MILAIQTDVMFSTLALAFILLMAMIAWARGTVGSLKALFSWIAAFACGIFAFKHGVEFYESWSGKVVPSFVAAVASFILAGLVFLGARILGGWAFQRIFGEEGPLAWMMRGPMGAALSLIPSLAMLIFISLMVRITGSVYEFTQITEMTQGTVRPGNVESLPTKPLTSRWRDGVEVWPGSKWALDQLDPLTSVAHRNLAAAVMASFNPDIRRALEQRPSTREIVRHEEVVRLIDDPELQKMVEPGQNIRPVKFLIAAQFRIALRNDELRKMLREVDMADEIESVLTGKETPRDKSWLKKIFS